MKTIADHLSSLEQVLLHTRYLSLGAAQEALDSFKAVTLEIQDLRAKLALAYDRIAAQSELLSKRAEKSSCPSTPE